jgi:hypothetical protein
VSSFETGKYFLESNSLPPRAILNVIIFLWSFFMSMFYFIFVLCKKIKTDDQKVSKL